MIMKQKMRTRKFQRYFLLLLLFSCPGLTWAQQETEETVVDKRKPLDLIFQKIDAADFNGSAYTISGEEIRNLPVSSLTNVLAGIVPGFFSRKMEGGMANEGAGYWIRGNRTYSEGVLVLVDGQERSFGVLSPHEIESITVLKDAAATVLYGMRGVNGVILVNTRKGSKGEPSVELTAQLIYQQPVNLMKPLNSFRYAENYNRALLNDGMDESNLAPQNFLGQYQAGSNKDYYSDIDWMDQYYKKNTWLQRYNMNISGGSERTRYFVNAGFLGQSGMFNTEDEFSYNTNNTIKRYNVRSNIEFDVTSSTLLSIDLYGWTENQNRTGGSSIDAYNALANTAPNSFPAYYTDYGNYLDQSGNAITGFNGKIIAGNGVTTNPWAMLNRSGYASYGSVYGSFRTQLSQDLSVIAKGLKVSATLSMDSQAEAVADRTKTFAYYQIADPLIPNVLKKTGTDGKMSNSVSGRNSNRRTTIDMQLSYAGQFNKHGVSAVAFYNQYEFADEVSIPVRFQGVGGWLNYNYDKRYSVDFMTSYQGCYKFSSDNRFGLFPTVAAGWTVSNEPFFKGLKELIPYLKFKGSYGKLGNYRGISDYRYMGRLAATTGIYNFGNAMGSVAGYVEDIIANPNHTWEKSEQSNVGIEGKIVKSKLSFSAEYFRDNRSDIYLTNNRIPAMLGTTAVVEENVGAMYTTGYDMAVLWNDKIGNVSYTLGGTWSISENRVTALGEVDQPYPWLSGIGYPKGVKRGYIAEGFFNSYDEIAAAPSQTFSEVRPGDIRYKDINNDGTIDTDDRVPIGYGDTPDIFYGITLGVSYKGFGVSALLQGAARVSRTLSGKAAFPFFAKGNMYEHQLNYWAPENQTAELPGISTVYSGGVNNTQVSSFWIRNADYLRLNTLQLYYDFPAFGSQKSLIKNIKLFANGYNLFTWTKYKSPLDPEADPSGEGMPLTRNISLGCSIKF
jgi:TonB-linked SusC/RagA family outer membrane protein